MKAFMRLVLLAALLAPTFASAQTASTTPPPAPTCQLLTSATTVALNTRVRLDWSSTNAQGAYLDPVGAIPVNGFTYVVPGKNITYTASFTGAGGTAVCRVGIAVSAGGPAVSGSGSTNTSGNSTSGQTGTNGSSIDTSGNTTGGSTDTSGSINTSGSIDTNNPINTNAPVNLNQPVNLNGPNPTLPTAPSVTAAPAPASNGGVFGGIVPAECRGTSTVANCDLCSLAQLGQNVANFLLGLAVPAAALLFAWAGILFFSSRGAPEQINRAKKIFSSVVIGFVIALSAWILVITVMNGLIHGSSLGDWNWSNLNCTATRQARLYNVNLKDYLNSALPGLSSASPSNPVVNGANAGVNNGLAVSDPSQTSTNTSQTQTTIDAAQDALQDGCEEGNQFSCTALDEGVTGKTLTNDQADALQDQCLEDGDTASCKVLDAALSTGTGNTGTTGATVSDLIVRKQLSDAGIETVSTGNCADPSRPSCTSLNNVNQTVVNGVIQTVQNAGYTMQVSGGSEGGIHVNANQNNGNSVDIRFADTSYSTDPNAINAVIQGAQSIGACAVFEPGPGQSCPVGVRPCLTGYATGAHFSYYTSPSGSPSCNL